MPITRDKASRLLTQSEMGLFGDSRNPALRGLSEKALASRVERTRKLRDKSRDLLQRQKLKSRDRTGSKLGASGVANQRTDVKGEILDDLLQRFESRLQEVQAAGEPAAKKRANPGAAANASVPLKPAPSVKAAPSPSGQPASKRIRTSGAHQGSGQVNNGVKPRTTGATSKTAITPKRALKNTHVLLEAKQQRDHQPPAYRAIDGHAGVKQPSAGFQSGTAKSHALELHEGEMRMEPIQGSISTHNRKNQGKRDHR